MVSPLDQLDELYTTIDHTLDTIMEDQGWWPCLNCPVATVKNATLDSNCCHHALFLVSKTEWDRMKQHPYIQKNLKRLAKDARRQVHRFRSMNAGVVDWNQIVQDYANNQKLYTCPLLDEDQGRCNIYTDRPTICRVYGVSQLDDGTMYGCTVVVRSVVEHRKDAKTFPTAEALNVLSSFTEGPVMPIVGWLADEKV